MSSVCVKKFIAPVANSLRDWQRQVQPLQEQHPEQIRVHCTLRCRRCVSKHNPSVQTRVRSQMRLARGRMASQHRALPTGGVKDGRSPTANRVATRLARESLSSEGACPRATLAMMVSTKSPCGPTLMMHRATRPNILRWAPPDKVCATRRGPLLVCAG